LIADSLQGVKKLSLLNCGITKIGLARFPGRLMENENKVTGTHIAKAFGLVIHILRKLQKRFMMKEQTL